MKRVEIIWQDTTSHSEWQSLKDAAGLAPMTIQIIGYLIKETDSGVIITSQVEATERDDRLCADVHIIPKGCILEIKELALSSGG